MESHTKSISHRRNDIQGLRAIGALLVAIYHIWIGRVSGGVDVFFIVSGFLLIGSLSRELQSKGYVDLLSFLSRLVRRLLPAAFLVIVAIMATGWLWLPKIQWDGTIEHLAASTLYVENWLLAFNSVDYLARDTTGSPVQHYWAMSAQVQSLLLIAGLLSLLGWVMRLSRRAVTNSSLVWFLAAIFLTSLTYSVFTTANNQSFAYFDTFARVWEFAAGGLLALILPRIDLPDYARLFLGWIGLVAILLCGIIIDVSTMFPGYVALWPIAAAGMVLIAGTGQPQKYAVERILGSKPLVWLGNISYSFYLWHWPLLVAYLTVAYQTNAPFEAGIGILLISIGLAYLTERYVERPFKKNIEIGYLRTFAATSMVVSLIGIALLMWNNHKNALIDQELALSSVANTYPGSNALEAKRKVVQEAPIYPGLLTATKDRGLLYEKGCVQSMEGTNLRSCTFGPEDADFELTLVGGSHSAQWAPALRLILAKVSDWRITVYTKAACPFSTEPLTDVKEYRDSCRDWNAKLLERLINTPPDAVMTLATRTTYPQAAEREHVPQGYRDQWLPLLENGISVVALRDTPRFGFDVPLCIDINGRNSTNCQLTRKSLLEPRNPAMSLEEADKLNLIDLSDYFCIEDKCEPVVGNLLVYRDKGHVSAAYIKSVAPALGDKLVPILTKVESQARQIYSPET